MLIRESRFGKYLSCSTFPKCKGKIQLTPEGQKVVLEMTGENCDLCGKAMVIRTGRKGKFMACSGYPECKNTFSLDADGKKIEGSRPLQTLWMEGVLAPKLITDRFNAQQRQVLYYDGIASYHVRKSGEVCIDRAVTTYQLNDWGVPNSTWLDVETMHQAAYAVRYLKAKVTGVWGRASLRDENPHGIQGVATAQDVRDTIVHGYRELSQLNVVENEDLFEQVLVVERNLLDPNRVDAFIPADHVNQLRIIGVNYTTHLQLPGAQTVVGGGLGLG